MFGFGERTLGEKIIVISAGALVVGNTIVNTINAIKLRKVEKTVDKLSGITTHDQGTESTTDSEVDNNVDDNK